MLKKKKKKRPHTLTKKLPLSCHLVLQTSRSPPELKQLQDQWCRASVLPLSLLSLLRPHVTHNSTSLLRRHKTFFCPPLLSWPACLKIRYWTPVWLHKILYELNAKYLDWGLYRLFFFQVGEVGEDQQLVFWRWFTTIFSLFRYDNCWVVLLDYVQDVEHLPWCFFPCFFTKCMWEHPVEKLQRWIHLQLWSENCSASKLTWRHTSRTGNSSGEKCFYPCWVLEHIVYLVTGLWLCVCWLRGWLKMKEVLECWLQTSGKDDQMEKNAVVQELKEVRRWFKQAWQRICSLHRDVTVVLVWYVVLTSLISYFIIWMLQHINIKHESSASWF